VIPYFYPAWQYGGTPRAAYELARGLVDRSHSVQVLTTDSGGSIRLDTPRILAEPELSGISVAYYRNLSNALAHRYRLFWPPKFFKELKSRLSKTDILHIHEFRSTLSVPAFRVAHELNIPYVVSPHGGLKHLGKAALKTVFDAFWGRRMLEHAAGVFAVSEREVREASEFGTPGSRVHYAPNAIDVAPFHQLPSRLGFRSRRGLREGPMVLFLGRLHWVKGADILIQAFQHIKDNDARLVIAGPDDGQERTLHELVDKAGLGKRVLFTGFLDGREKLEALVDCDVLVVPSRSEVFSLSAVEALMAKRPVLVSSACGLPCELKDNCGVLRFQSEDIRDLTRSLEAILSDSRFRSLAAEAPGFIKREFSANAIAERTESAYSKCIGEFQHAH
jgi:glycosyltransferase involved in cell wall biosynthesis